MSANPFDDGEGASCHTDLPEASIGAIGAAAVGMTPIAAGSPAGRYPQPMGPAPAPNVPTVAELISLGICRCRSA
ncbi:hypothetical protein B8W66_19890 [Mycobacterium decipiens]|uniref:Uncharacterized protein n=1 Tax=Mycobacterium decipiens TaxID=1430326 RepID=A0A1X2LQJ9_9MYCO|nr:hypothetical protein [Mycobacterium decipiens]OSC38585.1 hypothetical protein B8W66_19890 [Mycobacterium decipiens]